MARPEQLLLPRPRTARAGAHPGVFRGRDFSVVFAWVCGRLRLAGGRCIPRFIVVISHVVRPCQNGLGTPHMKQDVPSANTNYDSAAIEKLALPVVRP